MEEKDLILNLCEQIKIILYEIKEEEDNCNEGALTDYKYEVIINKIINIEKERLLFLKFWSDEYE